MSRQPLCFVKKRKSFFSGVWKRKNKKVGVVHKARGSFTGESEFISKKKEADNFRKKEKKLPPLSNHGEEKKHETILNTKKILMEFRPASGCNLQFRIYDCAVADEKTAKKHNQRKK